MSHELTIRENGKVEMAYVGETPWHGLGSQLEPGLPIERWIEAAGMDWQIKRARVRYATSRNADVETYRAFDDRVVLFRDDDESALGLVSDGFNIVQPRATLEFFRDLTERAGLQLNTAGTLFGGRKFWAMASLGNGTAVSDSRDIVKQNLLLATACDGSMATEAAWIATRVVCNNTLKISQREAGALRVKINHRSTFDPVAVKSELGIEAAQTLFERTIADMRKLAETRVDPQTVLSNTAELFSPGFAELDRDKQGKVLRSKPVEAVGRLTLDNAAIGADMAGMAGTAYGWLNAVTQYVDHTARARTADNRLDSAWFGKGSELKERAFEMALAGADGPQRGDALGSVNAWLDNHGGRDSDIA